MSDQVALAEAAQDALDLGELTEPPFAVMDWIQRHGRLPRPGEHSCASKRPESSAASLAMPPEARSRGAPQPGEMDGEGGRDSSMHTHPSVLLQRLAWHREHRQAGPPEEPGDAG